MRRKLRDRGGIGRGRETEGKEDLSEPWRS
jgi:hypothetical protein